MTEQHGHPRQEVATACRIVGRKLGSTGHVSARIDDREMYLRCRGENEAGLAYADTPSVRRMDFDGNGPLIGTYRLPHELPLHGEVYKARPDAQAVVHAHPYSVLLCGLVGVEFRPVFGGYQPPTLRIALDGVPVYDRVTQTITNRELALEMLDAMGDRNLVLLRGHGVVTTGRSVRAATQLALRFEHLAEITWQLVLSGRYDDVPDIPDIDRRRYGPEREGAPVESGVVEVAEGGEWLRYMRDLEAGAGLPSTASGDE